MSYPSYVTSNLPGRMRLRHSLLANQEARNKAEAILKKYPEIYEIKPGSASLLIFFDPALNFEPIFKELEVELPWLLTKEKPGCEILGNLFNLSPRKLELRILLAGLGVVTALGFVGSSKCHVYSGTILLGLLAKHIWDRKAAL